MRAADDIMAQDRAILRALAEGEIADQMVIARDVAHRRRGALKKLAE
jgi:ribosomal silencing factor RsfS